MRKRRLYLILIGVGVLVGVLVLVFRPSSEPEYAGKRLSEWLELASKSASTRFVDLVSDFNQTNVIGIIDRPRPEFEEPIRAMGTNALPYLLKWVGYGPPKWQVRLHRWIPSKLTEPLFHRMQKEGRAYQALMALRTLGSEASGGIPELTRLFYLPDGSWAQDRALIALDSLETLALPTFVAAITNQRFVGRVDIVNRIGDRGTEARIAVPALLTLLNDPNDHVRCAATNALLRIDPVALITPNTR